MANKKQNKWTGEGERIAIPQNAKRVSSELPAVRKPTQNSQIVGIFQRAKLTTITDIETHEPKEIMVYTFRDVKTGEPFGVLGGRVGLDNAFENLFDMHGGQERVKGMWVSIERGEDSERVGKAGSIGNYEVAAWVPERE